MDYSLVKLVEWTRRHGGDLPKNNTFSGVSDGTQRIVINDDGAIKVNRVDVAFATIPIDEWTADNQIISLSTTPDVGDDILITYAVTRFNDDQILNFLKDAVTGVAADMLFGWGVDETDPAAPLITDTEGAFESREKRRYEQLLVFRAGAFMFAAKSNQTAEDAIKIRDDDTSIDTSVTASSSEKALVRLINLYKQAVLIARSEGFMGSAADTE
jgi:hypothetical protein